MQRWAKLIAFAVVAANLLALTQSDGLVAHLEAIARDPLDLRGHLARSLDHLAGVAEQPECLVPIPPARISCMCGQH